VVFSAEQTYSKFIRTLSAKNGFPFHVEKKYAKKTNIARIFITFYLLYYILNDRILIVVYM